MSRFAPSVLLALLGLAPGCVEISIVQPDEGESSGESSADGTGTDTGDGDGDAPMPDLPSAECPEADCDDEGRCWTWREGWTADAQVISQAELDEAVDAGTLVPVPGDPSCWSYADGAHTCVLELDECDLLVGRPLAEVALADACDLAGAWSSAAIDSFGACWGRFDDAGLAVRLRGL